MANTNYPLAIYHHPCHDGFTAAWIAHSALAGQCDLHPAQYGDPLPDVTGRDVLVFDFSYPRETMIAAHQVTRSFRVFDHHKTAAEACRDLPFCRFEPEQAGCRMAWRLFHPDTPMPTWIVWVEDRDLWRHQDEERRALRAYMDSYPMMLDVWSGFHRTSLHHLLDEGSAIRRYVRHQIQRLASHAVAVTLDGIAAMAVGTGEHISEVCVELLAQHDDAEIAMAYFRLETGEWVHSMRSRENGVDVSAIAKAHGGGGHAHAAGFNAVTLLV